MIILALMTDRCVTWTEDELWVATAMLAIIFYQKMIVFEERNQYYLQN